jgi:hypothetical protein
MELDIEKNIKNFYDGITKDKNHRYKSWEHCYLYFGQEDIEDIEKASLHLAFYLASWGMLRGSSPLLWKDYLVHKELITKLLKHKNLRKYPETDKDIEEIIELKKYIFDYYQDRCKFVDGTNKVFKPSDILISKILLGVLGCVPAYDRYFKNALKELFKDGKRSLLTLSKESLRTIIEFYNKEERSFYSAQQYIKEKNGITYPAMKLIDMYFWNIGFQREKEIKNEHKNTT